jgi:hypothetical protein
MMIFAAYYGFTIDCNCNIAAYNLVIVGRIGRDLFRFEPSQMVRYRWPQPQASEYPPIQDLGAGPGQISLVLQIPYWGVGRSPNLFRLILQQFGW